MLNRAALQSQKGTSGRQAHCRVGHGLSRLRLGLWGGVLASAVSSAAKNIAGLTLPSVLIFASVGSLTVKGCCFGDCPMEGVVGEARLG